MKTRRWVLWVLVNLSRLLLAAAMIFAGAVKIIDPRGTAYKIQDYAAALHLNSLVPQHIPLILSSVLAIAEFSLGIYMLFGIDRRWTSRIILLVMLVFTPWTLYLAIYNPVHDCGCFGDALILTNWQTFWKNLILLAAAIVTAIQYRLQSPLLPKRYQWLVSTTGWLAAMAMLIYSIYTLPLIDFRPYHIGADLNEEMQWKDDGTIPAIPDLMITDAASGEDLTDSIISSPGFKFLIVSPRIELADDGVMDKLSEISDYCHENGYLLCCITSSDSLAIDHWRDITGADYPFCQADETPLKTAIRSNPGLILLHGSIVKGKWAASQLPDSMELNKLKQEILTKSKTK